MCKESGLQEDKLLDYVVLSFREGERKVKEVPAVAYKSFEATALERTKDDECS